MKEIRLRVTSMQKSILRLEINAQLIRFVTKVARGVIKSVTTQIVSSTKVTIEVNVSNTDQLDARFTL